MFVEIVRLICKIVYIYIYIVINYFLNSTLVSVSTFVPNRGSSFNCDIKSSNDHDNVCSYYWTTSAGWISQSSMQSDLSMVTDWRWESEYLPCYLFLYFKQTINIF